MSHCPPLQGYEFWDCHLPAGRGDGDIFLIRAEPSSGDPFTQAASRRIIALGDVSGKGMAASRSKAILVQGVGSIMPAEPDLPALMRRLNRACCDDGNVEVFATLVLVSLEGESHELTMCNAGHAPPMVRRCDGRTELIREQEVGLPLWVLSDQSYDSSTLSIGIGDVVAMYSDGLTTIYDRQGEILSAAHLARIVARTEGGPARVGEAILQAVHQHGAERPLPDDITLFCFGRNR